MTSPARASSTASWSGATTRFSVLTHSIEKGFDDAFSFDPRLALCSRDSGQGPVPYLLRTPAGFADAVYALGAVRPTDDVSPQNRPGAAHGDGAADDRGESDDHGTQDDDGANGFVRRQFRGAGRDVGVRRKRRSFLGRFAWPSPRRRHSFGRRSPQWGWPAFSPARRSQPQQER